jgi:MFS family permease
MAFFSTPSSKPPQPGGNVYVPDRLPAPLPRHDGTAYGIAGIACAIVAILFLPPLYGVVGLVCGIKSVQKGETILGIIAVILSSVCMIVGIGLYVFTDAHPEFLYRNVSEQKTVPSE